MQRFQVAFADPAWRYYGDGNKPGAAEKEYATMSDEDMIRLDMASYLERQAVLLVWATCPRLDFAIECGKAWGLHFRGVAFNWVKTTIDGRTIGAQGVRPSIVKTTTELVLAWSPVKRGRPIKLHDESIRQTIETTEIVFPEDGEELRAARPGKHSVKPDEAYARVEKMYPQASRVELFARRERSGWTCIGNELNTPSLVRMRESC